MTTTDPTVLSKDDCLRIETSLLNTDRLYEPFVGTRGIYDANTELSGMLNLLSKDKSNPICSVYYPRAHTWSYSKSQRTMIWTDRMHGVPVPRWKAAYTVIHEWGHDEWTGEYDCPQQVLDAADFGGFHRMVNAAEDPRQERMTLQVIPGFSVLADISHRWSFDQHAASIREHGFRGEFGDGVLLRLMAKVWGGDDIVPHLGDDIERLAAESLDDYVAAVDSDSTGDMIPHLFRIWLRLRNHLMAPPEPDEPGDDEGEGGEDGTEGDGTDGDESDGTDGDGDAEGDGGGEGETTGGNGGGNPNPKGDRTETGDGNPGDAEGDETNDADDTAEGDGDGDADGDESDAEGDGEGDGDGGEPDPDSDTDSTTKGGDKGGSGTDTKDPLDEQPQPSGSKESGREESWQVDRYAVDAKVRQGQRDVAKAMPDHGTSNAFGLTGYAEASAKVKTDSLRLMRGLRRVLADNAVGTFRRNEKSGRLDAAKSYRLRVGRTDIFRQRIDDEGTTDWSVVILVDHSSSTEGHYASVLRECSVMLIDAITRVHGVDLAVAGYGSRMDYAVPFGKTRKDYGIRLCSYGAGGGTDEAIALEWAIAQTMRRDADGKLILVLTDGEPNDPDLARALAEQARSYGIHTAGIGIAPCDPGYHPVHRAIEAADFVSEVPLLVRSMLRGKA